MKKAFLTMTGCLIATVALFSQTDTTYYSGFKFGFTYPVSTHGLQHTHQYSNAVSVNLLVGVSGDERAFAFSGLANIVRNNITGFQFAGLYNHAGNNGNGFAMSGLGNNIGNNYNGFLFAGLYNHAGNNGNGFAMSGLGNNIGNNYNGFLFAGLLNRSREMCGVQMTGLVNMAGNVRGIQFAGLVNMAANVSGVQIAGLVNVAKNVKGIQFAGLVNVADSSDYPIAIINIIKNGEKSIALSYNETGSVIVSFRSGGKVTYGIIGLGYNHKAGNQSWLVESGLGAHINCSPRFRINNELTVENFIMSKNAAFKAGYRLSAAYRFFSHMEIFAGTGISYMQTNDDSHTGIFPRHALWKHHNGFKFRQVSIGYQFGVQYIF